MCRRRIGHTWPQGHMWTAGVVMKDPRTQDRPQMRFGQRYQPIRTLATDGADESFANGVRLWGVRWRFKDADTEPRDRCIQMLGEYAVAIVDQVSALILESDSFA